MNCKNCGAKINDDDLFCGVCGTPVNREPQPENNSQNSGENSFDPYAGEHTRESAPPQQAGEPQKAVQNINTHPENSGESSFNPYSGEFNQASAPQQPAKQQMPVQERNIQPQTYIQQPQQVPQNAQQNKITVKLSKSKIKIVAIVAAAVIVAVVALSIGIKVYSNHKLKQPIEIDLSDYITDAYVNDQELESQLEASEEYDDEYYDEGDYYDGEDAIIYSNSAYYGHKLPVHGYDGYAYVDQYELMYVIDWDSLFDKVNEEIHNKKGYDMFSYSDFINNETFMFSADKTEDISNGDTITVNVSTSSEEYVNGDVTLIFKETEKSYKIESLKTVTTIDPFKYVTLYCIGASGNTDTYPRVDSELNEKVEGVKGMSVRYYDNSTISIYKDDYIVSKISFELPEDYNNVSNGDTVILNCYCSDSATLIDDYNLYIAKYDKTYTVEDLGDYVTKDFKMSDADLKAFRKHAYSVLTERFDGYDYYSDFNFNCAYISDMKDKTESYSDFRNALYVIYSYKYTDSWTEEVTTYYFCVEYRDIIAKDGKVDYSASDYYYDYHFGNTAEEFIDDSDMNYKKIK